MENLAKWAEVVIAFLLCTFLVWFCLEYLKGLKKANDDLEKMKDEQGRQRTTVEQIKFENRSTASEIHSMRETIANLSGNLQREMENRNLRLREIEDEARKNRRDAERLHRRVNSQDEKLRHHSRIIKEITTEGENADDDSSSET